MIEEEMTHPQISINMYELIEAKVSELYVDLKLNRLPINPFYICKVKGYLLIPFSKLDDKLIGFYKSQLIDGLSYLDIATSKYIIHYNDGDNKQRQNFTIMHEIGHILLGHKEESELANQMANCFASYTLAPSPLIDWFKCKNEIEIYEKFGISLESTFIVYNRYLKWKQGGGVRKNYEADIIKQFLI